MCFQSGFIDCHPTVASVASIGIFFAVTGIMSHLVAFVALFTVASEIAAARVSIARVALAIVAVKQKRKRMHKCVN